MPACMWVSVCLCIFQCLGVCVTVQGRWGSVSGSVCVCAAGTVHVCLPGAVWRGGQEAGGWTADRLLRHHLQMEQKHSCYCSTVT